jgi:hypothetical protein
LRGQGWPPLIFKEKMKKYFFINFKIGIYYYYYYYYFPSQNIGSLEGEK